MIFMMFAVMPAMKASAYSTGDDYPYKDKEYGNYIPANLDPWGMYYRECTSFVAWCLQSRNGYTFNRAGKSWNANLWGGNARSMGFTVDMNPQVGSVAWWDAGFHVAWVREVSGDSVFIEEYNYGYNGTYHERWISKNSVSGYIHFKDLGATPVTPSQPTLSVQYPSPEGNEAVLFNWNACSNTTHYDLRIYQNGQTLDFFPEIKGTKKAINLAPGIYEADLASVNAGSGAYHFSDRVSFTVGVGSRSVSGDFNGDGLADYAAMYDYGLQRMQIHTFLSTGTGFSEEVWYEMMNKGTYAPENVSGRMVAGDFNGDGLDDIAAIYDYWSGLPAFHVFLSNGISFELSSGWGTISGYSLGRITDKVVAGDFNADGKADIAAVCDIGNNIIQLHVWLSNGTKFEDYTVWQENQMYTGLNVSGRVVSGDFNGDGKDDICALYNYSNANVALHVWESTGTSFTGWNNWGYHTQYNANCTTGKMVAGDFNGDGKDDVSTIYDYGNGTAALHMCTSNGSSFTAWDWRWHETHENWYHAYAITGRMVAGDFDGDGKDDIVAMYAYGNTHAKFHVFRSNGDGITTVWQNEITGYDACRTTGIARYYDDYTPSFTLKEIQRHTVSYNANNGNNPPKSQTKWNGEALTLSDTVPIRTGYTFLGWSTNGAAASATYAAGSSYTANAGAALYAVWEAIPVTVKRILSSSYNLNENSLTVGGISSGTSISSFLSNLSSGSYLKFYKNGNEITFGYIGTGTIIAIVENGAVLQSLTAAVTGDVDGDGSISTADINAMKRGVLGLDTLTGAQNAAACLVSASSPSVQDIVALKRHLVGISEIVPK